ncbi:hypothetical protein Hanom_Chr08g00748781 [Helianthus anomalus]
MVGILCILITSHFSIIILLECQLDKCLFFCFCSSFKMSCLCCCCCWNDCSGVTLPCGCCSLPERCSCSLPKCKSPGCPSCWCSGYSCPKCTCWPTKCTCIFLTFQL